MEEPEMDLSGMGEPMNEVFEVDPRVLRQELGRIRRMVAEGKVDHHFGGIKSTAALTGHHSPHSCNVACAST